MEFRSQKSTDEIRRLVSDFIEIESNKNSLITVTKVELSADFKKAVIFVTVFPEHFEKGALDFLKRQRGEMRDYLKKKGRLANIPFLDVSIDEGEKSRQRLDEISKEIKK